MALIHVMSIFAISLITPMSIADAGGKFYLSDAGVFGQKDGKIMVSADAIEWKSYAIGLMDPKGIAVLNDTSLLVVDMNSIWLVHSRKAYLYVSQTDFPMPAKFLKDIAVGPSGEIYVTDMKLNRIFRIDPMRKVDTLVSIDKPSGITVAPDSSVYFVTFTNPGAVYRLKDGKISLIFTSHMIDNANSIAIDPYGHALFVSSYTSGNIVRIDLKLLKGQVIDTVHTPGDMTVTSDGKFLLVPLTREAGVKKISIK